MKAKPKLLGVCSHIAHRYDLDVFVVRLATLGIILASGIFPGFFMYVAAGLLIDE